jgi:hypothetical protein
MSLSACLHCSTSTSTRGSVLTGKLAPTFLVKKRRRDVDRHLVDEPQRQRLPLDLTRAHTNLPTSSFAVEAIEKLVTHTCVISGICDITAMCLATKS